MYILVGSVQVNVEWKSNFLRYYGTERTTWNDLGIIYMGIWNRITTEPLKLEHLKINFYSLFYLKWDEWNWGNLFAYFIYVATLCTLQIR